MKKLLLTSVMMAGIVSFAVAQEAPKKAKQLGRRTHTATSATILAKKQEEKKQRDAGVLPANAAATLTEDAIIPRKPVAVKHN